MFLLWCYMVYMNHIYGPAKAKQLAVIQSRPDGKTE